LMKCESCSIAEAS